MWVDAYFVDTTDTETKGSTFDTSAVHVVTNQKNQLNRPLVQVTCNCAYMNIDVLIEAA